MPVNERFADRTQRKHEDMGYFTFLSPYDIRRKLRRHAYVSQYLSTPDTWIAGAGYIVCIRRCRELEASGEFKRTKPRYLIAGTCLRLLLRAAANNAVICQPNKASLHGL